MNNTTETKECTLCKKTYPLSTEYFGKDKKGRNGLSSRCKVCLKKLREDKKEIKRQYDEKRRSELQDLRRKQSREWYWNNKEKKSHYDKKYRIENKEKRQEQKRKYYVNNREKIYKISRINCQIRLARKKKLEFNYDAEKWLECKKHFNYKCAYCGCDKKLEQEHFIPLSQGGEYTVNNIVPACRSCNASKSNRDFFEWYSEMPFYSTRREQKVLKYLGYKDNKQQLALFK